MRNMQGPNFISRVNFQTTKHHRQILREQIKPQFIQKLQLSQNPSANYIKAYRNVFKDQLEKTMEEHYNKKIKDEHQQINDKLTYSLNNQALSRIKEQKANNSSIYQNHHSLEKSTCNPHFAQMRQTIETDDNSYDKNGKFRDYYEQRTNKFQNLVKSNYDGGQQFFKVSDALLQKKMKDNQNYVEILKKQLQQKQRAKMVQRQKENMEQIAFLQMQRRNQQLEREKLMREREMRQYQGAIKLRQYEQQKERKNKKSQNFYYKNVSLHNPITNPIEYHIDNPYILKKIQDKTFN